jgi:4-diphosphocytidyl-2-C-methyl-D-erythritol kinase
MTLTISAPAKVNLHLEVLGPRKDGYHDILSLFQMVSLCDEIEIRIQGPKDSIGLEGSFEFSPRKNSIVQAVELFRGETGIHDGLSIRVEKRIPLGSGMGGGSSDAAAAIRALQVLFGVTLGAEKLLSIGAALGSDVPFFLLSAAALVEGRGERVSPISARDDFALIAVTPDWGMATSEAYRWIDQERSAATRGGTSRTSRTLEETYRRPVWEWDFSNDFDRVVFRRLPELGRLRDEMEANGALDPRLTGSGSTLIGLVPSEDDARACCRRMAGHPARVLRPLALMPLLG